jgi:C1A family cysteine protease
MKKGYNSLYFISFIVLIISANLQARLSREDTEQPKPPAKHENWTFEIGENPATQYSLDQLCGAREPNDLPAKGPAAFLLAQAEDLPASFDWREIAGCPPVRNQGACGACWAFATVGTIECAIMIQDGVERDLSEQWLVSCNWNGFGCGGGTAYEAYRYFLMDDHKDFCGDRGAPLEEQFPYIAQKVPCGCPYIHHYYIDSWDYFNADVNSIKQAIINYGPIYTSVNVNLEFQWYTHGVFNDCTSGSNPHAVVLVGWDDNPPDGGSSCPGVWILRNSWGDQWGEDGYMRIEYGCSGIGTTICYIEYSPRDFVVSPLRNAEFLGQKGGPFNPSVFTYTVINNSGVNDVNWTIDHNEPWFSVVPDSGVLGPLSQTSVQIFLNPDVDSMLPGTYSQTLTFSGGLTYQQDVTLTVQPLDYFTERFDFDNDLDYKTLTLKPCDCASSYTACTQVSYEFPTDPAGGTTLPLGDEGYAQVLLSGGKEVKFYGDSYSSFYVGSNGYITFTEGDTAYKDTLETHFNLKRISLLLDDLNPAMGGTISVKELEDRVAVTYQDVPEYYSVGKNTFQLEMFFSGVIRMTWLYMFQQCGTVGISNGQGIPPDFAQSDISLYEISAADIYTDCAIGFRDYAVFALSWLTEPGDTGWDPVCDISLPADKFIDAKDLNVLTNDWLK